MCKVFELISSEYLVELVKKLYSIIERKKFSI